MNAEVNLIIGFFAGTITGRFILFSIIGLIVLNLIPKGTNAPQLATKRNRRNRR